MTTHHRARDPQASISRDVLVYPACGQPHICKMDFNEAGRKLHYGLYITAIDLRSTYGTHVRLIRVRRFVIANQPDKRLEGEYVIYYNLSPGLPANASLALIVGVNPKRPGRRPMWRGDVVVVKRQGQGYHVDYLDVQLSVLSYFNEWMRDWYLSEDWANTLKHEQDILTYQSKWPYDPFGGVDIKRDTHLLAKLKANEAKQAARLNDSSKCAGCDVEEQKVELRWCSGCHRVKYCSKPCQKTHWKAHRRDCNTSRD